MRVPAFLLSTLLAFSPAWADELVVPGVPAPIGDDAAMSFPPASGASYDAATIAWVNAVTTAGGAVSSTQEGRVNTLVVCLKTNTLWTSPLDRLWLYAGESDAHQAAIDIKALAVGTLHGTATLAAGGYTGDGTTGYIDTGFNPVTAGGNYAATSGSLGAYDLTNNTGSVFNVIIGQYISNQSAIVMASAGPQAQYAINSANSSYSGGVSNTDKGLWIASLSSGTTYLDKNGTNVASFTPTSPALLNNKIFALAQDNAGTASGFIADQIASVFIAGGMTPTQQAAMASCLNGYMTAWGINVY